ncbi:uncharacterized protein VP01_4435g3 [Puccinia sorghi]|uniref:Reverse transcriptase Ty1/copia-type domain-containing protein n=1 Tax=Puccinia sorghi TaxID=27349 RepID=A0A0L6UPG7_9BASI|nr:uncharacterized protein VP01_4435g3 [Puccinia sorghi]
MAPPPKLHPFNSNFITGEVGVNPLEYLSVIMSLNYMSVGTRPDITHGVNCLARFSSRPFEIHWKALKHLIGYLAGTKDRVLLIKQQKDTAF